MITSLFRGHKTKKQTQIKITFQFLTYIDEYQEIQGSTDILQAAYIGNSL